MASCQYRKSCLEGVFPYKVELYVHYYGEGHSMKHALRILMNNFTIEETSFLYKLREEGYFDFPAFWDYYNSVRDIIRQTLDKPLDREISRAIVFTHSKILEHIIWDYSDQDIYHIQNLPYDKLHDVLERLGFLVDGYLQGFLIDEQTFGPDFKIRFWPK